MTESTDVGPVVIAVDQGTSATKGILVGADGEVLARTSIPLTQSHPQPGWVEQDPVAILDSVRGVLDTMAASTDCAVAGVGFSTQRESAVAWDRRTGSPLSAVLGWQDRRTAPRARELASAEAEVRRISGLPLDPMFSAMKFQCILDDIDPDRRRSRAGDILLGTVDSWLLWNLVGEHRIEVGNASRTQLLDLGAAAWSPELLDLFDIPLACLPEVRDSDSGSVSALREGLVLRAVLGDSHAALFGHGAREPGPIKATYGTGSSVMGLTDRHIVGPGLVGTIAWGLSDGGVSRAFEGNILSTGATLQWLARVLDSSPTELAELARTVPDSGGVDLVPAFAGLGAPWWDERASGVLCGIELGTERAHIARAAFESVALQVDDVLRAVELEIGVEATAVLADGGPTRNAWLMQLQADISERAVSRHDGADVSAIGAARLAAETAGVVAASAPSWGSRTVVVPRPNSESSGRRRRWADAVARSRLPARA